MPIINSEQTVKSDNLPYQSSVIQTLFDFEALQEDWQTLLLEAGLSTINLDYDWLLACLKQFPASQPFVILVRNQEGKLIGAAPFKISHGQSGLAKRLLRHVQFIGSEPFVYEWMTIICRSPNDAQAVLQEVAQQLLHHRHLWDVIDLRYCCDYEKLYTLSLLLSECSYKQELRFSTMNYHLPIEATLKTAEGAMKKNVKNNFKRRLNRIREDHPDKILRIVSLPPSLTSDRVLDAFFEAYLRYWAQKGVKTDLKRFPFLKSFYTTLFRHYYSADTGKGRIELSQLMLGDEVISTILGFWQGGSFMTHMLNYNPLYTNYDPGVLHFKYLMDHLVTNGGISLDFGRGSEPYKTRWTDCKIPLWNLLIFKTSRASLYWQTDTMIRTAYSCLLRESPPSAI